MEGSSSFGVLYSGGDIRKGALSYLLDTALVIYILSNECHTFNLRIHLVHTYGGFWLGVL